jgi:hypothetical protein
VSDDLKRRPSCSTGPRPPWSFLAGALDGFFSAVDAVLLQAGVSPAEVKDVIVHATTL